MNNEDAIQAVDKALREINFYHEIDFCLMMIEIIEKVEHESTSLLLKYISENFRKAESAGRKDLDEIIGQQELNKLKDSYGSIVDGLLDLALKGNPDVDDFYEKMGKSILNPIFDTKNSKAFALYYQLIDKRLPYFKLKTEALKLADEVFEEKQRGLSKEIENIRHILARDFDQKTMEADNLLEVIESSLERDDRVILMTAIVQRLRAEYELLKRRVAGLQR